MTSLIASVDNVFAAFTILGLVMSLGIFVSLIARGKIFGGYREIISKNVLWIGFLVSFATVTGSLFYSEIAKYAPCVLCWYQRIFMYPQAALFSMAIIKKERTILPYALALSVIGGGIALFHYYGQMVNQGVLPCRATEYSISCAERLVFQYGFVTIPFMSFAAFLLIALSVLAAKK